MKLVVNYSKDYAVAVVALDVGYDADLRTVFDYLRQAGAAVPRRKRRGPRRDRNRRHHRLRSVVDDHPHVHAGEAGLSRRGRGGDAAGDQGDVRHAGGRDVAQDADSGAMGAGARGRRFSYVGAGAGAAHDEGRGATIAAHSRSDLVDERDGDRSFADGRRDALDVAAAHVADREDAGQAGLEQIRRRGPAASSPRRDRPATGPVRS